MKHMEAEEWMFEEGAGSRGISSVFVFAAPLQMRNMRKSRGRANRISVERARYNCETWGKGKSTDPSETCALVITDNWLLHGLQ